MYQRFASLKSNLDGAWDRLNTACYVTCSAIAAVVIKTSPLPYKKQPSAANKRTGFVRQFVHTAHTNAIVTCLVVAAFLEKTAPVSTNLVTYDATDSVHNTNDSNEDAAKMTNTEDDDLGMNLPDFWPSPVVASDQSISNDIDSSHNNELANDDDLEISLADLWPAPDVADDETVCSDIDSLFADDDDFGMHLADSRPAPLDANDPTPYNNDESANDDDFGMNLADLWPVPYVANNQTFCSDITTSCDKELVDDDDDLGMIVADMRPVPVPLVANDQTDCNNEFAENDDDDLGMFLADLGPVPFGANDQTDCNNEFADNDDDLGMFLADLGPVPFGANDEQPVHNIMYSSCNSKFVDDEDDLGMRLPDILPKAKAADGESAMAMETGELVKVGETVFGMDKANQVKCEARLDNHDVEKGLELQNQTLFPILDPDELDVELEALTDKLDQLTIDGPARACKTNEKEDALISRNEEMGVEQSLVVSIAQRMDEAVFSNGVDDEMAVAMEENSEMEVETKWIALDLLAMTAQAHGWHNKGTGAGHANNGDQGMSEDAPDMEIDSGNDRLNHLVNAAQNYDALTTDLVAVDQMEMETWFDENGEVDGLNLLATISQSQDAQNNDVNVSKDVEMDRIDSSNNGLHLFATIAGQTAENNKDEGEMEICAATQFGTLENHLNLLTTIAGEPDEETKVEAKVEIGASGALNNLNLLATIAQCETMRTNVFVPPVVDENATKEIGVMAEGASEEADPKSKRPKLDLCVGNNEAPMVEETVFARYQEQFDKENQANDANADGNNAPATDDLNLLATLAQCQNKPDSKHDGARIRSENDDDDEASAAQVLATWA